MDWTKNNMKNFTLLLALIFSSSLLGQTYIYDGFNYESFEYLESLFTNQSPKLNWTTNHASNKIDINENGMLDSIEKFKKVSIVNDPHNYNNKIIRFELNRVDPFFFTQYGCDDINNDNVLSEEQTLKNYDSNIDTVCINCEQSPLGRALYQYRTHMNRNEIVLGTKARRKAYKANKTYWIGLKTLIDEEYEIDVTNNSESIAQFLFAGSVGKNPPVALLVSKDRFKLALTRNNGQSFEYFDLGPVTKDEWINWKLHLNFSSNDKKALLDVWRSNELIASVKGANTILEGRYYFKIGIYKWGWWDCNTNASMVRRKVISYDDVWVSKKDNSAHYRK